LVEGVYYEKYEIRDLPTIEMYVKLIDGNAIKQFLIGVVHFYLVF